MPVLRYEITADEAWTHTSLPPNRYWCFFGGIFGPESDCDRLETALRAVVVREGLNGEVKWSSVTGRNIVAYKLLVDEFFRHISAHGLTYRQVFLDRSYVHVPDPGAPVLSPLDIQFKIYYQFLKHHFGLRYLPASDPTREHHVTIRLDGHSSWHHTDNLSAFVERLGGHFNEPRLSTKVHFVNSERFMRLQICDLLMAAAGSYGNRMHERRECGRRGMTRKQACRLEMAKYIYNHFRALDAAERGTRAFNWFESTGKDGDRENTLKHKLRIWKFIPNGFRRDEGWQNKNLGPQGIYLGPQIDPTVHNLGAASQVVGV